MNALVFDLDETLIDRFAAVNIFATQLWRRCFDEGGDLAAFLEQVHKLDGYGHVPRDQFFASMLDTFTEIEQKQMVEELFYGIVWETPQLAVGVKEILQRLKKEDARLGIVTNGSVRAQEAKIKNSGLREYFDVIVVSEAFGVKKPDPSIFLEAARQMLVEPGDCWFVGDHPLKDIWGSKQIGFMAGWVHRGRPWSPEIEPCYDVSGENFADVMKQVRH